MPVPEVITKLIENFDNLQSSYTNQKSDFNETSLRQHFLDPFFIALGWDVYNAQGLSPLAREVSLEQTIKISGTTDFIDYSFKIGRDLMFIAEAKAPKVKIFDNAKAAYQVRRYAWNAKLTLCILTNFNEFAIYDCTKKPSPSDPAGMARIEKFTYKDLPEKWDDLLKYFSKQAVYNDSFANYAKSVKGKKGTCTVDEEFLREIESWRDALAKNIALRNPSLTVEQLNYSVQIIIDRIIFLQNCEDRLLEEYGTLKSVMNSENIYNQLIELFRKADKKYNSGIFYFEKESDREGLDELTPLLKIDDKVLKGILHELCEGSYEFSVIPPEILGQVYEQFLGKVIRLTEGHQARVEFKPEVKKAGGVFYTPQYIVEYIVKHTVGELVKDKTPREVAKLRILDPACGSGSFLLGAYQFLLEWHLEWYTKNLAPLCNTNIPITDPRVQALLPEPLPRKKKLQNAAEFPIYRTGHFDHVKLLERTRSDWALSTTERKRILLNNIYGVDIDHQAVEVTKLSLLLKVLEGDSEENIDKQLKLCDERALPSLHKNIKCGNSLIGTDIRTLGIEPDEITRINPFDWEREFADVMTSGGFDAVIGNPPYIRIQTMKEWAPTEVEFYKTKFVSASKGNYDIYVVFVEKGLSLLNKNGLLGYILPHKFFNAQYGESLRSVISNGKHLKEIVHFGHQQVFENATTYTCLLILGKKQSEEFNFVKVDDLTLWRSMQTAIKENIPASEARNDEWNFVIGDDSALFKKLLMLPNKLGEISKLLVGLQTSADPIYILTSENVTDGSIVTARSKIFPDEKIRLESKIFHPLLKGSEISRYQEPRYKNGIIFPYKIEEKQAKLITLEEMKLNYPLAFEYLKRNKNQLQNRSKSDQLNWWLYPYPKNLSLFERPKILCQVLSTRGNFSLDHEGKYYFVGGGTAGGYAIYDTSENIATLKFYLGILNSKITTFFVSKVGSGFRSGFYAFGKSSLENFPIPLISAQNRIDVARHDKMVELVTKMLDLNKKIQDAKLEQEKIQFQRLIDATDDDINKQVYELYGLTPDEIAIVEGKTTTPVQQPG